MSAHRPRPRLGRLLRSQGLGVACGLATVALLGLGSVIMAATRDGASRSIRMDDISGFFNPPSLWHGWFYALIPVLGLFALNTLLCTYDTTVRRFAGGKRAPWHHGPSLIHISFLVLLLAHLIGGIWGKEGRPLVLDSGWRALGDGREGRVVGLSIDKHPNGQPKQVRAKVELRHGAGGETWQRTVAYNQPLTSGWGARLFLLTRYQQFDAARLSDGETTCSSPLRGICRLAGRRLHVLGIYRSGHWGKKAAVRLLERSRHGKGKSFFVLEGRPEKLADGKSLRLLGVSKQTAILLRRREAPGTPWALASILLLVTGIVSIGRRWWQ